MAYAKVYRPLVGIVKRNTEKAILLVLTDPEALTEEEATLEVWLPKSQLAKMTPLKDAKGNMEVMTSEWIITTKELTRFISSATPTPATAGKVTPVHPPVPTTPPVNHWADMDDDIPF